MVRSPLNNDVRFKVEDLNEEPREQKTKGKNHIADGYETLDQADSNEKYGRRERKGLVTDKIYSSRY